MRKTLIVLILLCCSTLLFARGQFRMTGEISTNFADKPSLESLKSIFDDTDNLFAGFHWEVLIDRLGFGMHYRVKFDRVETGESNPEYDWSLDWDGDMFLSYHFFGAGSFLDPYVQIGLGSMGRVDIDDDDGYWILDDGVWEYYYELDPTDRAVSNLSLYGFAGAGFALNFDGFLLGAQLNYRPVSTAVPGTQFDEYPMQNFQFLLYGGIALGGRL